MTVWRDKVMHQLNRFKWVPKSDSKDKVYDALQPAIRFTKSECLDLPEVMYQTREVPLSPQALRYYNTLKKDMLIQAAPTVEYWSAEIGRVWDGSAFQASSFVGTAWTNMTWYQTLGQKMQRVSNKIHQLTMRGGANFAVVSPTAATILETIPGFLAGTDGDKMEFAAGVTKIGSFQNRFTIYKNPYMKENVMLLGFRGSQFLETGAVYAPYIPLIMTLLVYDPNNFTPRRGVMTRYAKKIVRPEFFGKIYLDKLALV
jgi:hypothetical protein